MKENLTIRRLLMSMALVTYVLWGGLSLVIAQTAEKQQSVGRGISLTIIDIQGDGQVMSRADVGTRKPGDVRIQTEPWKPANPRSMLDSGDQLKTGPQSSMKLQLNDGTIVTLAEDSVLVVEDLRSTRGESPQTSQLKLERGKISTQQGVQLLGQTQQIIRTDNGLVNTQLGEVEIWKPVQEPAQYVRLASLLTRFPLFAQKRPEKNDTFVTLSRGSAMIESSGNGRMIANSLLIPETCIAGDGINFTLDQPKTRVNVTKIEDRNAFRLSANEPFYLLVGTEGTSNKINVATENSNAVIDIEGVEVAEQKGNSMSLIRLHPLLTVGVKASELVVNLNCEEAESRGINDFAIQGMAGQVDVLRTSFGGTTGQPAASRGGISILPPTPPGPTPTPTPTGTPRPTPTPTVTPPPPPTPFPPVETPRPLTSVDPHIGSHHIQIISASASVPPAGGTVSCGNWMCGVNEACTTVVMQWFYPPNLIPGGGLYLFHEPIFPVVRCQNIIASRYIPNDWPGDTMLVTHDGNQTITFSFCYPYGNATQHFSIRVSDKEVADMNQCDLTTSFAVFP
jgi:hypothetical protein